MVVQKFQGLGRADRDVVRFIEQNDKAPQTTLRTMERNTQANNQTKECMLCLKVDKVNPSTSHMCDPCLEKLIRRYGKVKMQKVIFVQSRRPHAPEKQCEHCHNYSMWHSQINILLCNRCLHKVNSKIMEATVWRPFVPSLLKRAEMKPMPRLNVPMWRNPHRAW